MGGTGRAPRLPPRRAAFWRIAFVAIAAGGPWWGAPAPAETIRVGLADATPAARISSERPFGLRSGELRIEASEVLLAPETRPGPEVVILGTFALGARADDALASLRDDHGGQGRRARDPATGRYVVVVERGPARSGGASSADRRPDPALLRERGFRGARAVRLPVPDGDALVVAPLGGLPIRIPGGTGIEMEPEVGAVLELDGAPYRGTFSARRAGDGIVIVNRLDLDDYLVGVVPAELPPDLFPELEALKAQALAARTYALRHLGDREERGYDICSGPACQVYGGVSVEHPLSTRAVRETAGEVILHEERLIDALYTASCGGRTENAENVFRTPTPYLTSRACLRETAGAAFRTAPGAGEGPLELAIARLAGRLPSGWTGPRLGEPASRDEAEAVVGAALAWLGLGRCAGSSDGAGRGELTLAGFASLVEGVSCRAGRTGGRFPAEEGGSRTAAIRRLLEQGLLVPDPLGLSPDRRATRREVIGTAARLLARDGALFREGKVVEARDGWLVVESAGGPGRDAIRMEVRPGRDLALFREFRDIRVPGRDEPPAGTAAAAEIRVRVGDVVRFAGTSEAPGGNAVGAAAPVVRASVLVVASPGEFFDRFSSRSAWFVPKNNTDLSASVNRRKAIGRIVAIEPLEHGPSGRVVRIRVRGTDGELEARGLDVRRLLGLSDMLFFAEPRRSEDGDVREWWFTGGGWGHGLGLCQAGAYGMAAAGFDYREIVGHFYPGTEIRAAE